MANNPQIVIAGAGTLGCFVGGLLAAGGHRVSLLSRPNIVQEIRAHGLSLTDFQGMAQKVDAEDLTLSERPECLAQADIIVVTVRSDDTDVMARSIAAHAPTTAKVISLQDDVESVDALCALLPNHDTCAAMVPFHVARMGQGCFHRFTAGDVRVSDGALANVLSAQGLMMLESNDITGLKWGKFLLNLNDGLNALSGLTLYDQLNDPAWRKLLADQWVEALRVLKGHKIKPVLLSRIPARLFPMILRLPTPLFLRFVGPTMITEAQERSLMSHDLVAGRKTEIDAVQGQVIKMGAQLGLATPISAMVVEVMKLAQTAGEGLPNLPAAALRREIRT